MNTLSLILVDERENGKVLREQILSIPDAYQVLDECTEIYETNGIYLVNEVNVDTHTLYRQFATKEEGLVLTLVLCGGRAISVRQV